MNSFLEPFTRLFARKDYSTQTNMSELRTHLAAAAAEAASKPAVITSSSSAIATGVTEWVSTGPGIFMALGFLLSVATFLLTLWKVLRDDKRAEQRHAVDMGPSR